MLSVTGVEKSYTSVNAFTGECLDAQSKILGKEKAMALAYDTLAKINEAISKPSYCSVSTSVKNIEHTIKTIMEKDNEFNTPEGKVRQTITDLRSLIDSLNTSGHCRYHLGIHKELVRSTLSYANNHRCAEIFEKLFYSLRDTLDRSGQKKLQKKFLCYRRN